MKEANVSYKLEIQFYSRLPDEPGQGSICYPKYNDDNLYRIPVEQRERILGKIDQLLKEEGLHPLRGESK